jgi:hypothetical protein
MRFHVKLKIQFGQNLTNILNAVFVQQISENLLSSHLIVFAIWRTANGSKLIAKFCF